MFTHPLLALFTVFTWPGGILGASTLTLTLRYTLGAALKTTPNISVERYRWRRVKMAMGEGSRCPGGIGPHRRIPAGGRRTPSSMYVRAALWRGNTQGKWIYDRDCGGVVAGAVFAGLAAPANF